MEELKNKMNNKLLLEWWNNIDHEMQFEWFQKYIKGVEFEDLKLSRIKEIYFIINVYYNRKNSIF